jgi:ubiquinone biosynthesis protein UbiJ
MAIEFILQRLTSALNTVLKRDEDFQSLLNSFAGKSFAISVQGVGLLIYVEVSEDLLLLTTAGDFEKADLRIEGPPLALLSLLKSADSLQQAQKSGVKIQGDLHVARQLSEFLSASKIDWEDILAQYTGDFPGHQFAEGLKKILSLRERVHKSWRAATSEYLQEEARSLPARVEIEHFMDEVDSVRDSVARLEARIASLRNKAS